MTKPILAPLDAARVAPHVDQDALTFLSTDELEPLDGPYGQDKALTAIDFALTLDAEDYHLYVAGPPGTGKSSLLPRLAARAAAQLPTPPDICYVHRFDAPDAPQALVLPPGVGQRLAKDMKKLVESLTKAIPEALQHRDYRARRQQLLHAALDKRREHLRALEEAARAEQVAVDDDGQLPQLVPLNEEGVAMRLEEIERLDEPKRRAFEEAERRLRDAMTDFFEAQTLLQEDLDDAIEALERKRVRRVVDPRIQRLRKGYADQPLVLDWLAKVQADVLDQWSTFLPQAPSAEQLLEGRKPSPAPLHRYEVNVLVDNSETQGGPVIVEWHPTFGNLIGRIERRFAYGTMETNHTLVRAGALLRANGGFLVLEARELLTAPLAWHALKRCLRARQVQIEDPDELGVALSVMTLQPDPIPLRLKVLLLGGLQEYLLLQELDEGFPRHFKIRADFDTSAPWSSESAQLLLRAVATCCRDRALRPLDRSGAAALLEQASRLAGRQDEVTLVVRHVEDLLVEANHEAALRKQALIDRACLETALEKRRERSNLYGQRLLLDFRRGTLLVAVQGARVGQINGLALLDLGDCAFAMPARITARTFVGTTGVVNIERESELSGEIHAKAVLILTGLLGGLYAQEKPLSMTASLTFEQSYGRIDGDSASVAEALAILSSLAELPLRQDLAVTGSLSQHGEVQPVGGINEKIEGFFDVCAQSGLTGSQGVAIPAANIAELHVAPRVRDAIRDGRFHLFAMESLDEAITLFFGHPAGERRRDGTYPPRSVHGRVHQRLLAMAESNKDSEKNDKRDDPPAQAATRAKRRPPSA